MTPQAALAELLERMGAQQGAAVYVGMGELHEWPADAVAALKSARVLVKARAASRIICPGCERECTKPVEVYPTEDGRPARAHIYCDEPEQYGRIDVELSTLEQWRVTGEGLAGAVSRLLGFNDPPGRDGTGRRWTLGLLKGKEHKSTIKLAVEGGVSLAVAGHTVALADILSFDGKGLAVDRNELSRLVDKPAPDAKAYKPSITRREARKLDTRAMHERWKKAYRALKRKHRDKSDVWCSLQIAKTENPEGRSADTIRKNMKS